MENGIGKTEWASEANGLMPYAEIARRVGLTTVGVIGIERRALKKIRRAIVSDTRQNRCGWADVMKELGYPNAGI